MISLTMISVDIISLSVISFTMSILNMVGFIKISVHSCFAPV